MSTKKMIHAKIQGLRSLVLKTMCIKLSAVVIGGRQVFSPLWTVISPFLLVFGLALWNYTKLN